MQERMAAVGALLSLFLAFNVVLKCVSLIFWADFPSTLAFWFIQHAMFADEMCA